ncbi:MAG: ATP-binding protein [Myxococcaceae bacterium]
MDIRTQSALLAAIVSVALGVSMLLRPGRVRVVTRYAVFALTLGGYYGAQFFSHLAFASSHAPWVLRIALFAPLALGTLVPPAALAFFLEFLNVSRSAYQLGQRIALLSTLLGFAVALSPLANLPWAQTAVGIWAFGGLATSVSLLVRRMRQSDSRLERARLMYLASGAAAALVFSALDFLPRLGVPFPTLGPAITTLFLFLLAQTLLRFRLLDLHELLGKLAAQSVLASIVAVVFVLLTAWAQATLALFIFNTVLAAFVLLILLEPLKAKVEERVVAIFFRERFQLVQALTQLRARMVNVIDATDQANLVLDALAETRRMTHASIYLLAEDRPGYRLLASRGPPPVAFLDMGAARGLLSAAAGGQKAVLAETLERRVTEIRARLGEGQKKPRDEIRRLHDTRAALTQMKAGISAPLLGNDRVIGFLNLWDERVPEAFASDEIALILEVTEALATTIENSKLYEKMRERDRLAALGEMSAGLAHEIRNPLGAIKGAAQCLDPKGLPGEDRELIEVIVEEVNRLNGVVSAFLDYARPLKQNFGPTDLNEVVTRTTRLIQNEVPAHLELTVELASGPVRINGDAEQLKQVLINLVQNAIQALGASPGRIVLRTHRPERFSEFRGVAEFVELQVEDTGPGIPLEQQPNIFVPFFTTKSKGTGLGLAICQRIVKNHGGSITAHSRPGEGSQFVVRFPGVAALEPRSEPDSTGTPSPDAPLVNPEHDISQVPDTTRESRTRSGRRRVRG